jgi:hypothetical protein
MSRRANQSKTWFRQADAGSFNSGACSQCGDVIKTFAADCAYMSLGMHRCYIVVARRVALLLPGKFLSDGLHYCLNSTRHRCRIIGVNLQKILVCDDLHCLIHARFFIFPKAHASTHPAVPSNGLTSSTVRASRVSRLRLRHPFPARFWPFLQTLTPHLF